MKQFVDRELEMRTLEREYAKKEASLVIVYGRRRVGKTTLLNEFAKDKKTIYFWQHRSRRALIEICFGKRQQNLHKMKYL